MNQATIQSIIQKANRRKIAATDALFDGRIILEHMKRQARDDDGQTQASHAIKVINSAIFHANAALKTRKDKIFPQDISKKEARIIWRDPFQLTRSSELRDAWDDVIGSTVSSLANIVLIEVFELVKAARSKQDMQEILKNALKNISQETVRAAGTSLVKSLIKHSVRKLSPKLAKSPFPSLVSTLILESTNELSQLSKGRVSDRKIYRSLVIKSVQTAASWTGAEMGAMISAPLGPTGMFLGGLLGGKLGGWVVPSL